MGIIRIGDTDYHEESYRTGFTCGLKGINACPDGCNFVAYAVGNRRGKELRVEFRQSLAQLLGNRGLTLNKEDRATLEGEISRRQEMLNLPGNSALEDDDSLRDKKGYVFSEDYGDHQR